MAVAWDSDPMVARWGGLAPLTRDTTADACVVGLGASGLAAVEALLERGLSVVGLDASRVAAGAAGRNGGFLLAGCALNLHDAIRYWGVDAAVGLHRETLAELRRCTDRPGGDVIQRVGSIRLAGLPGEPIDGAEAADRAAELLDCELHADALRAYGFEVETYEGHLGRGLYFPADAAVNPAARAIRAAEGLRSLAALHEYTTVTALARGRVVTERAVVSAGVVVVAIDGGLDVLLPELSGRLRTARLQMLATAPVRPLRLPCPVYARWGYDYAQQDGSGRLYVGGGRDRFIEAEWTTDTEPTVGVQGWIGAVADRMAGQEVQVTHRWAASVGYTPDARPVVLELEPGLVVCGGYNGTGNLVGPVAARAAVALAVDGTAAPAWCRT